MARTASCSAPPAHARAPAAPTRFAQRRLPLGCRCLAALERRTAKLDRAELAATFGLLPLGGGQRILTATELCGERVQVRVTLVQLRRAVAQHLLHRGAQLACPLLATLQVGDCRGELLGAQLELASALGDQLLDRGLGRRPGVRKERPQTMPDAVLGLAAARPVLPVPPRPGLALADSRIGVLRSVHVAIASGS